MISNALNLQYHTAEPRQGKNFTKKHSKSMKSPNHIIVTGCMGPFYNEKLFINNDVTIKRKLLFKILLALE